MYLQVTNYKHLLAWLSTFSSWSAAVRVTLFITADNQLLVFGMDAEDITEGSSKMHVLVLRKIPGSYRQLDSREKSIVGNSIQACPPWSTTISQLVILGLES